MPGWGPEERGLGRPEDAEVHLSGDVAVQVVHDLLREHRVPASRIARDEHGLTWWGPRLAQRFTVSGPVMTGAGTTWWLSFETDFLAGFEPGSRAQLATATMLGWSFELFTAGIVEDKVVLRGRTFALEEERARRPAERAAVRARRPAERAAVRARGLAERAADLGRRALVASQVAHTYARWYLDGTLKLPETGVHLDASVPPGPVGDVPMDNRPTVNRPTEDPPTENPPTQDPPTENPPTADRLTEDPPTDDQPDPAPVPGAIMTADDLDLTPVTTFLTDRGMTSLDAPPGKLAFGGRLPTSKRDVVVLLDATATHPHAGPGLSVLFSPVGLADDRAVASAAENNATAWSASVPPVGMGTWSGRRGIGLSYANFLAYRWTAPDSLLNIIADDLGHVLQADRDGWLVPR